MTIPYTYLLKSLVTGDVYYGVRFARNCHPSDFWQKYFTSSNVVHEMIEMYGKNSFVFEIRKTFTSGHDALKWEQRVLQRMKVCRGVNIWLNRHDGTNNFKFHLSEYTPQRRERIRKASLGRKHSDETKKRMSLIGKGRKHSEETKAKIRESKILLSNDQEYKKRLSDSHKGKKTTEKQKLAVAESNRLRHLSGKSTIQNAIQSRRIRVSCDGKVFDSISDAQKHFPGIKVVSRLDNPKYPTFFRII